ncbi:hypothetical protein BS50DRAFT_151949 [Corynespora cassiicola Philippines]|uniref:Uncharacterized protein n=1 Tax=Corynespora cassiicola Philippines TaxID=1448308 RepID=A0A2T2N883_CORCC|nr:hypothetical protein BS50DRAFT_151949 [Corynespora cassiicola Philippines]
MAQGLDSCQNTTRHHPRVSLTNRIGVVLADRAEPQPQPSVHHNHPPRNPRYRGKNAMTPPSSREIPACPHVPSRDNRGDMAWRYLQNNGAVGPSHAPTPDF